VPGAADIQGLVRFFEYLGDLRISVYRLKKSIDVDDPPALGKSNVLLRGQPLIAEKQSSVLLESRAQLGELVVVEVAQVYVANLGANRTAVSCDLHQCMLLARAGCGKRLGHAPAPAEIAEDGDNHIDHEQPGIQIQAPIQIQKY